jgi:hypothetical protein
MRSRKRTPMLGRDFRKQSESQTKVGGAEQA